ncbi:hypothetical protein A4H97_33250 [Niastella yeongjuensis]|uniref:Uncharacterized protein n=1 Tax=Niastella yeongjuensis TaxID=354355 RepID=A0A1V9EDM8_9BACT|nr:hypothetical protein [Niastella yeongjuensis]OQP44223.1 hypothetical protein A4H97_33250 [Niastella yeongjuensis]SEO40072.1 hypothetical protein SAMN05660816_02824 [Niastella yeongjuensis]
MKKVKFSLILSALIALTVTQSSAKAIAPWDYPITQHASKFTPLRARTTSLDDVTLLLSNYADLGFEIWLYSYAGGESYYVDIPSYQSGHSIDVPLTVPEGNYDITFASNNISTPTYHLYTVGCDLFGEGSGYYVFTNVSISGTPSCNKITIE